MRKIIAIGGALAVIAATFALVPPGAQASPSAAAVTQRVKGDFERAVTQSLDRAGYGDQASNFTMLCVWKRENDYSCYGTDYVASTAGRPAGNHHVLHYKWGYRVEAFVGQSIHIGVGTILKTWMT
jgi:hypothetical protein